MGDIIVEGGSAVSIREGVNALAKTALITPMAYGATGDGIVNDTVAIKAALAASRLAKIPLTIDRSYRVDAATASDPIRLIDGDVIEWAAKGVIVHGTYGVPVFWNFNEAGASDSIVLRNPKFKAGYTITAGLPAIGPVFKTYFYTLPNYTPFPDRNHFASLFMMGTDLVIEGKFTGLGGSMIDATKFLYMGLSLGYGAAIAGSIAGNNSNLVAGDFHFDGYVWGVIAWCYDSLKIGDMYGDRYTMLDPTVHTSEAPAHLIYCTSQGASYPGYDPKLITSVGNVMDTGAAVGISDHSVSANNTAKFTQRHGPLNVASITTSRRSGGVDIGTTIAGFNIGPISIGKILIDLSQALPSDYSINKAMRLGLSFSGGSGYGIIDADIGPATIIFPDSHNADISVYGTRIKADITLVCAGTDAFTTPMIVGEFQDSELSINVLNKNSRISTGWTICRIDGGRGGNRLKIRTNSPDWLACRPLINNVKGQVGNTATVTHLQTGNSREIGTGAELRRFNVITSVALSGATVTVSAAVPKGARLTGVQSVVTQAITGATGYTLGISGTAALYGTRVGTGVNGGTDDNSWASDGGGYMTADRDIIFTASGSNFTGGNALLSVQYTLGLRNLDSS